MKMNKKGFTLVELMVVLAILGLLAGIGIPQYMQTLENSKVAADNAAAGGVSSALIAYYAEAGADLPAADTLISAIPDQTSILNPDADPLTFEGYYGKALPTAKSTTYVDADLTWDGEKVVWK